PKSERHYGDFGLRPHRYNSCLDKYWCLICDKVRRADQESYDPCVHVAVFNVAVFDRGDENSLEALMQSAQCGDAAQQLYRSNRKPMRRFLRMKRACPTASAMLTTGQPDLGKRKSDAHP